jgi:hypothetical protein
VDNVLFAEVVRVHCRLDDSGIVRDVEVLKRGRPFDLERAVLPHGDETLPQAIAKIALFPVREVGVYGLLTVALTMSLTMMPYGR